MGLLNGRSGRIAESNRSCPSVDVLYRQSFRSAVAYWLAREWMCDVCSWRSRPCSILAVWSISTLLARMDTFGIVSKRVCVAYMFGGNDIYPGVARGSRMFNSFGNYPLVEKVVQQLFIVSKHRSIWVRIILFFACSFVVIIAGLLLIYRIELWWIFSYFRFIRMSSGTDLVVSVNNQVSLVIPTVSPGSGRKWKFLFPCSDQSLVRRSNHSRYLLVFSKKTQPHYLKAFTGLNILLIGDASIRTLYRDLCKMIRFGRLLKTSEANRHNGNYPCLDG